MQTNLDCKNVQEEKYKHKDCRNTNTKMLTMLKAVELPASVPDLAAGLTHVHADTFPLRTGKYVKWICIKMHVDRCLTTKKYRLKKFEH